jgi:hypothetical protein
MPQSEFDLDTEPDNPDYLDRDATKLPPLPCPVCVAAPAHGMSRVFWQAAQKPGITYRCGYCGRNWQCTSQLKHGEFPILRADGQIDWSQPQPDGTYRCTDGWESGGAEFGCMERSTTTCSDNELRCTQHALIDVLGEIRTALVGETERADDRANDTDHYQTELLNTMESISAALWEINYRLMPLRLKLWYPLRCWIQERGRAYKRTQAMPRAEYEREEYARNAVRNWLKNPTPDGAHAAANHLAAVAHCTQESEVV